MSEVMFKAIGQVRTQASETDIRATRARTWKLSWRSFLSSKPWYGPLSKGGVRNGKGSYRQRPVDSWSLK